MLYCATEPEGALGEKLAPFMPNVSAVRRIEAFLVEEPDPEFGDDYLDTSLGAEDIDSFGLLLAHAPAASVGRFIDAWHPATTVAVLPRAASLLREFGLARRRAPLREPADPEVGVLGTLGAARARRGQSSYRTRGHRHAGVAPRAQLLGIPLRS